MSYGYEHYFQPAEIRREAAAAGLSTWDVREAASEVAVVALLRPAGDTETEPLVAASRASVDVAVR